MKSSFTHASLDVETTTFNFHTARQVFEQYLRDLPGILSDLQDSADTHDIFHFRQLIHELIPRLKYVGLAELTKKLKELEANCFTARDLVLYSNDIRHLIEEMNTSKESTSRILKSLTDFTSEDLSVQNISGL